jgi:tyrosine-protein kinase Etk/Wzc
MDFADGTRHLRIARGFMRSQLHIPAEQPVIAEFPNISAPPEGIRFLTLVLILARRWALIAVVAAICTASGIALALLLPVRYTAEIVILPPQQENSSITSALAAQFGGLSSMAQLAGGSLGLKNKNDMYVSMFKSHLVEDAIIQRFNLQAEYRKKLISDTRKVFEKRTSVDGGTKDGLIHIAFQDHDPRRAAEIANGYVDQFRVLSQHLAIGEAAQRRLFLEGQVDQSKQQLAGAEEAMKNTEQKTGLIELNSQARALIESASYLRAQIAAKQVQIQGMKTYATDQNSGVAQAEQELASLRAQMQGLTGSQDVDGMIIPKGQVTEAGLEYVRKMRDVKYNEAEFALLSKQLDLARLDEAREGSIVQVVDPAFTPDQRSFPHRTLIVLAAAAAGLFLGCLIVLVLARLTQLKSNPQTGSILIEIADAIKRRDAKASSSERGFSSP